MVTMSIRSVALLRGVNIGGVRFAMKDLAAALTADGFTDVKTVLASGNVVVTAADGRDVAADVARVILETFGFTISVIVVDADAVRTAVEAYPFERSPDRHAYVVFGAAPGVAEEIVAATGELDPGVDQVAVADGLVYWGVPKGLTLDSPFGKQYGKRQKSGVATTRNVNTLEKILAVV
jgi:uncharacterized protein (DUF1697 family)